MSVQPIIRSIVSGIGNLTIGSGSRNWTAPFKSDLALDLREMVEKSDGFYLKDYSDNACDSKLVNSYALNSIGFAASLTGMASAIRVIDNGITEWEFIISVTDKTISTDQYTNGVLCNGGMDGAYTGVQVVVNLNKIEISMKSSTSGFQKILPTFQFTDDLFHRILIKFNTTLRTVDVTFDGVTESFAIVPTGSFQGLFEKLGFNSVFKGGYALCSVKQNGNYSFLLPFCTNQRNYDMQNRPQVYDIISGTMFSINGNYTSVAPYLKTNNIYPSNCIYGFDLYKAQSKDDVFLPLKLNGDSCTAQGILLSGYNYTKYETNGGNGYNYCDVNIQVNPNNSLVLNAGGYDNTYYLNRVNILPPTSNILFTKLASSNVISRLLFYFTGKTLDESKVVANYLGLKPTKTYVIFGDSIAQGVALKADLPEYLKIQQPLHKIYIHSTKSIDVLDNNNASQPPYTGGLNTGFVTQFGYLTQEKSFICMQAYSGSTLAQQFNTFLGGGSQGYYDALIIAIIQTSKYMLRNNAYPIFEIYGAIGTNDAGTPGYITSFEGNLVDLVNQFRVDLKQNADFHLLRAMKTNAGRIAIADATDAASAHLSNFYIYDGDELDTVDNVHPSPVGCIGYIQMANMFYNKTHL